MGDFRIVIDAIGGHGQDREKKDGEVVDFTKINEVFNSYNTPEQVTKDFIAGLRIIGCSVQSAKIIHWPIDNYPDQRTTQIEDDLITCKRSGNF